MTALEVLVGVTNGILMEAGATCKVLIFGNQGSIRSELKIIFFGRRSQREERRGMQRLIYREISSFEDTVANSVCLRIFSQNITRCEYMIIKGINSSHLFPRKS